MSHKSNLEKIMEKKSIDSHNEAIPTRKYTKCPIKSESLIVQSHCVVVQQNANVMRNTQIKENKKNIESIYSIGHEKSRCA